MDRQRLIEIIGEYHLGHLQGHERTNLIEALKQASDEAEKEIRNQLKGTDK
jgi:hypothetical protein